VNTKARSKESLTIRLNVEIRGRLEKALDEMPYRPSITSVIERGIILAIDEIERMKNAVAPIS
jgi:hypothetical protein